MGIVILGSNRVLFHSIFVSRAFVSGGIGRTDVILICSAFIRTVTYVVLFVTLVTSHGPFHFFLLS